MDHHEFSPSKLEQFRLCPGAYTMQKGIPDVESEWAKEGTMLHNAVATNNDDGLTEEQIEMVEKCRDFIAVQMDIGAKLHHEQKFAITDMINGKEELITYGTADVVIFHEETKKLTVIDWKFGYTPVNDVAKNLQLACYAVAAMMRYNVGECDCWVFQPRLNRKSHFKFTNGEAIVANIRRTIARAQSDTLILSPSESACRYCRARLNCPAFRVKFQKLAASRSDYDLSNTQTLERLYDASKSVKSFLNDIETAVKDMIEKHGSCGKYKFKISDGSREIKDLNALYATIKDLVTPREFIEVCKVTLGKLETLIAEKLIAEANAKGEKLTKTNAKSMCYSLIASLISRGNPTRKIIEFNEEMR